MGEEEMNRIVIFEKGIHGDLSRCIICKENFTAIQPCIVCASIIEKEKELGRKLDKKEFESVVGGWR
jgi:hypothetical protein